MTASRFRCMDKHCDRYARVAVEDAGGKRGRACARHALAALDGLVGARVIWDDARGINDHEATAFQIAEERSRLSRKDAAA